MAAPKMLCWQEQHELFEWEVPQRSSFSFESTTDKNRRQEAIFKIVCLLKELTGSKLVIRTPLDVKVKRCGCKQPLGVCHRILTVGKHLTIETQTFPHCYTDFKGGKYTTNSSLHWSCSLLPTAYACNHADISTTLFYRSADKSLAQPGRKQANVSVRMVWISFSACHQVPPPSWGGGTWWQLASRCCWNHARPWHASELLSFLVGLRTYQRPGSSFCFREDQ